MTLTLALPPLAGVELESALARCGDNTAVLLRCLQLMLNEQCDFAVRIKHSLIANRPHARRMAHSLKGAAGNLGMTALSAQALELLRLIDRNQPEQDILQSLERLEIVRQALFRDLQQWLRDLSKAQ